ncbi:MAG TPA: DUF3662 and FHA domain-containing protein [Propionibacteriaceae bacterium]
MGIFERFEKKVEGAVSGAFARAFKGDVQPVEIAARLQRELDAEAKLMSRDKRLVPNQFVVGLSQHDHDKLAPYAETLTKELAEELRNHASEMGYVFNGPIKIVFELSSNLPTGRFTVASEAVAGVVEQRPRPSSPGPGPAPSRDVPPPARPSPSPGPAPVPPNGYAIPSARALVLEVNGTRHELQGPSLTIGRGTEADLRINDPGISRLHAEIRVNRGQAGEQVDIVDLGSTNGIVVNGQKVRHAVLQEGTRIEIGSTRMLVHAPAGR